MTNIYLIVPTEAYMGEHLSPSGGRDLEKFFGGESKEPKSHLLQGGEPKKLTKFRGGIQRNCHFFQILGGEFFGWGKNFSEGGEYFAKEYPSRWGGISTQNFSGGGGYPRQLPPPAPMYASAHSGIFSCLVSLALSFRAFKIFGLSL